MPDDRMDDVEERMIVLRDKAAREGFAVPPEVLEYIADKYALPQTLKGALINVQAYASRRNIAVDMNVARLVLDGIRPSAEPVASVSVEADAVDTIADVPVEPTPFVEDFTPSDHDDFGPGEDLPAGVPDDSIAQTAPELADALESVLGATIIPAAHDAEQDASLVVAEVPEAVEATPHLETLFTPPRPEPIAEPAPGPVAAPGPTPALFTSPGPAPTPEPEPATVWFAPVRTSKKESLVTRAGRLLERAGLHSAISEGDLVAIKLHFGEEGNTGFVSPVYVREVVRLVKDLGGRPFLTDSNTLYQGKRSNAVDHIGCAIHNGFSYATVEAPIIIADGIDGHEAVDVPLVGYTHFDSVRIGAAAAHADALVVVTHVKGHEATGMGGALKNVGMGLGCRSAKQRMHSDLKPEVSAAKCTACGRCVKWCPVEAIAISPDRVARIDYEVCYGCGECVASCAYGAIGIQWKTEPDAIQEKIVEHVAGALAGKDGKVVYLSFVMNVSPDCDCWNFSDASVVSDIGVLASDDIVAIDQAALDLVSKAPGLPSSRGEGLGAGLEKFGVITGIEPALGLGYAEAHGLGTRSYVLRTLD